ncbi:hypothetical protein ACFL47_06525 [Candidatus Latescibacterota bacterium]
MVLSTRALTFYGILILLAFFAGCESEHDRSVTGDFFDRKPGDLVTITATIDSITQFLGKTGESSYIFAGRYNNIEAFSLIKFTKPSADIVDNLDSMTVKMSAGDTWRDGIAEFSLFGASSDWVDSIRIEPDMFDTVGLTPVSTASDTSVLVDELNFSIPPEYFAEIRNWDGPLAFKVSGSENGGSMVALNSLYSNHKPKIELIYRTINGLKDTTTIDCVDSNYFVDTGYDKNSQPYDLVGLVSDADAGGFVMNVTLPDSLPATAALNRFSLTLDIIENGSVVPSDEPFYIGIFQLSGPMNSFEDAAYTTVTSIEQQVDLTNMTIEFDLTYFLETWHKGETANHGIFIRPVRSNDSPSQIICLPRSPMEIIYTSLPEAE